MTNLAERMPDLDAMGIERQVIKPSPFQCYYGVPPEIAVATPAVATLTATASSRSRPRRSSSRNRLTTSSE